MAISLGGVILLLLGMLAGFQMVRVYLHSEAFRVLLGEEAGKAMRSDVKVGVLRWQGLTVHGEGIEAIGHEGSPIGFLEVSELRGKIGLDGFGRGVWRVQDVRADRVTLDIAVLKDADLEKEERIELTDVEVEPEKKWWSGWLPDEVEFEEIEVREANMRFFSGDTEMRLLGSGLKLKPRNPEEGYEVEVRGGNLRIIPFPGALKAERLFTLRDAWINIDQESIWVRDSFFTGPDGETAEVNGMIPFDKADTGSLRMGVNIRSLPISAVLGPEWTSRVLGRLDINATVDALPDDTVVVTGKVSISDGRFVTQGLIEEDTVTGGLLSTMRKGWVMMFETMLPVMGAYTEDTMRFRNLVFNRASADFRHREGHTRFTNIYLQSEGALTIEGSLDIDGDRIDGYFQLGMTQEVLRRIPGAEDRVFVTERDGLRWAPVRVTGTLSSPREDLSGRLFAAAGGRIIEALPEAAMALIQAAPEMFNPGQMLDFGGKLMERGGGAVESAAGLLDGILGPGGLSGQGLIPGVGLPERPDPKESEEDEGEDLEDEVVPGGVLEGVDNLSPF